MRCLLLAVALLSANAYSQSKVDPKCIACVTAEQRKSVQKKLDDLRAKVKRLEEDNRVLRNRPVQQAELRMEPARTVEVQKPNKKNRASIILGYGSDSITNRRKEDQGGNSVEVNQGPVGGVQYQRLFGDTVSAGVLVIIPTRPDEKKNTYAGSVGLDF